MGRNLGQLGKKKVVEEIDFEFFGATIRVNSMLTELAYIDFVEKTSHVDVPDDLTAATPEEIAKMNAATTMVKDFLRELTHPDDFETLWSLARMESYGLGDLMELAMQLIEGVTARPTGRPSDSSTGPVGTAATSVASLSDRVSATLVKRGRADQAQAVRMQERALAAANTDAG